MENKKRKIENIRKQYPNAIIFDITSSSENYSAQVLSPFYPHNNIPIPFSDGMVATCVEAVWQGLKVFETEDINLKTFKNASMKNLKRTVRTLGKPLGHRKGVNGTKLLNYFEARMLIYLPTYKWVLENVEEVKRVIEEIKKQSQSQNIILLDYNTNTDFRDISSPISHAGLIKLYVEGNYPKEGESFTPLSKEGIEKKRKIKKEKIIVNNQLSLFDLG